MELLKTHAVDWATMFYRDVKFISVVKISD